MTTTVIIGFFVLLFCYRRALGASSFLISSPRGCDPGARKTTVGSWSLATTTTTTITTTAIATTIPFRPEQPELRLVLQETVRRDEARRSRTPP